MKSEIEVEALEDAVEALQARVAELEGALVAIHNWVINQSPHSSTLHSAQKRIERRLASIPELEGERDTLIRGFSALVETGGPVSGQTVEQKQAIRGALAIVKEQGE